MKVAVAGLGFMGATHMKAWKQVSGAEVAAVVSSQPKRLAGDLTDVGGNLGATFEVMDFSAIKTFTSFEAALLDPDIDAIDICLPTDQHSKTAIAALRARKHVLVEKPMAVDAKETSAMLEAAAISGRTMMVGQVLRFFPAYVAIDTASPIRFASFRRQCGAPTWSRWLTDPSRGGGAFDLLIHDVDFCISRWGMPDSFHSTGYRDLARGIDLVDAELRYRGLGPVVISGGWRAGAYPFSMQFTVTTDRSTVEWSSGAPEFVEYGADGSVERRALPDADPFAAELQYFADCVVNSRKPERCPPEQSAQAVTLMREIIQSIS